MLTSQYDESVLSEDVVRKIQCITSSILGFSRLGLMLQWIGFRTWQWGDEETDSLET